jgi:hypothetical protein
VHAEIAVGTNPLGLMFPSPRGKHWRSSNFDRRVLAPAYLSARWRDADGNGEWTWHSLRHVPGGGSRVLRRTRQLTRMAGPGGLLRRTV